MHRVDASFVASLNGMPSDAIADHVSPTVGRVRIVRPNDLFPIDPKKANVHRMTGKRVSVISLGVGDLVNRVRRDLMKTLRLDR